MNAAASITEYCGPERLYRGDNGCAVINVHHRPDCYDQQGTLMLPAAWTATALGWYLNTNLVGESPDKQALIAYCRDRFPGCEITESD